MKKALLLMPLLLASACTTDMTCLQDGEVAKVLQVGEQVTVIDDEKYQAAGSNGPNAEVPRLPKTEGGGYLVTKDTFVRLMVEDHLRVCSANGIAKTTLKVGDEIVGHESQWLRRVF